MVYHRTFSEGAIAQHDPAKEESLTSPGIFVKKLQKQMPEGFNTESVIFCYSAEIFNRMLQTADRGINNSPIARTMNIGMNNTNPLTLVRKDNGFGNFAICHPQAGASNIAILAEELYAAGFERFLLVGPAGHVYDKNPTLKIGDFVIAEEAFPYDATSHHYSPEQAAKYYEFVKSMDKLVAPAEMVESIEGDATYLGMKIRRAKVATTGALYRETPAFAREVLSRGVEVLDMETTGLYSVLKEKEYALFASILYITDRVSADLSRNKWDVFFGSPRIYIAQHKAAPLCIESLRLNEESYFDRRNPKHPHTTYKE